MTPKSQTKVVCLSLLFLAGTGAIHAAQFGDFTYESSGTEITMTGYTGPGGDVTIPETIAGLPVASIGAGAFFGCTSLTSVTIPDSVTSIEGTWVTGYDPVGAFRDCTSLKRVTIGRGVTNMGAGAFWNCTALRTVTISQGVTCIGEGAFYGCTSLMSVEIPDSVTRIAGSAFEDCTSLRSIEIPNSVTSIESRSGRQGQLFILLGAFRNCTSLESIKIPSGVTFIGNSFFTNWCSVFNGCSSLTAIEVDPLNSSYSSLDGVLFNKDQTTLLQFPGGKAGSYTIPDGVNTIGREAFFGCNTLLHVSLPETLTNIGGGAFAHFSGLTSLTIPASVNSIGWSVFRGCTRLATVYFEGDAPVVDEFSFYGCPAVILCYREGTTGWGANSAGRPTALWVDPPVYSEWLASTALPTQYPDATAESDDPDQDGLSNYAEMLAGTDPADATSVLALESEPRPDDLTEADRTPVGANQRAIYFRSVPGKNYGLQWTDSLEGASYYAVYTDWKGLWRTEAVVTATTTQTRFVFDEPLAQAFYRMILAQCNLEEHCRRPFSTAPERQSTAIEGDEDVAHRFTSRQKRWRESLPPIPEVPNRRGEGGRQRRFATPPQPHHRIASRCSGSDPRRPSQLVVASFPWTRSSSAVTCSIWARRAGQSGSSRSNPG